MDKSLQVDIVSGAYEKNYGNSIYARGHMCPNADRKSSDDQNWQTYYPTNQVPQIQNGFNSGIWNTLEGAVRNLTSSTDTVYVALGPCYKTAGGSETVSYLTAVNETINPQKVPIPNYFYKVLLKVKRNGDNIISACAIGFWLEHKDYKGETYASHSVSVDKIEQLTGMDFFVNLPDSLESTAEANTSWDAFSKF